MLDSWGHGKAPRGDWTARPATLTLDDGDGHFSAWSYTGSTHDAALTLAGFLKSGDAMLAVLDGARVYMIPRDEWAPGVEEIETDADGEPLQYHYHPNRHPGGLLIV